MTGSIDHVLAPLQVLAAVSGSAMPLLSQDNLLSFVTNSTVVALVVLGVILWFSRKATTNMQLVPHKAQNFFELVIEFLYARVEAIVGSKVAPKAFPLLATLFIFILISNWFGLFPGIGTIGWGESHGFFSVSYVERPLLRPPTADMNMTLGMALCFVLIWLAITIGELGVWGFIKHTFGPKGGLRGLIGIFVALVFFVVGVIEVVSMVFRPMSLSLRLYGNVYAGETLLHTMGGLLDGKGPVLEMLGSILFPIPFYFMELLIGLLQAVVFTLLCAVYIQLSTTHDEHEHEGEHAHDEKH
ncbi:F0F1 ATP synthase subunit A [Phragmitibacter flavus]|uniref:ATP synthase subunit a n=1 Tax=Phragmitibacter flavus TaxID=2576071 RepID=A0A5R8KDQ7_9BACT|nr:F0F1 ATP synthase subunit A [Phragmitibacter flavus]TLD70431.1 F0F1 ATP synthase subunit A [Phragmitibacter flavus]